MSSTNKTTYYELPQFVDNDIFNPLVDDNDAYSKIDTALHNIANAEADDASDIVGIKSRLDSAEGDIDALKEQNGNSVLTTTAQTLSGAVNELDADISSLDGRLDIVEDDINNVSTGLKAKVDALETAMSTAEGDIDNLEAQCGNETLTTTAQTLSGAVNELDAKFKGELWVSVKDFGAVGDGVTNDYLAIKSAIEFCNDNHKKLYFPKASYMYEFDTNVHVYCDIDFNNSTIILKHPSTDGEAFSIGMTNAVYHFDESVVTQNGVTDANLIGKCFLLNTPISLGNRYGTDEEAFYKKYVIVDENGSFANGTLEVPIATGAYSAWNPRTLDDDAIVIKNAKVKTADGTATALVFVSIYQNNVTVENIHLDYVNINNNRNMFGCIGVNYVCNCNIKNVRCFNPYGPNQSGYIISCAGSFNINVEKCICVDKDGKSWGSFVSDYCDNLIYNECVTQRVDVHIMGTYEANNCKLDHANFAGGHGNIVFNNCLFDYDNTTGDYGHVVWFRSDYMYLLSGSLVFNYCKVISHTHVPVFITMEMPRTAVSVTDVAYKGLNIQVNDCDIDTYLIFDFDFKNEDYPALINATISNSKLATEYVVRSWNNDYAIRSLKFLNCIFTSTGNVILGWAGRVVKFIEFDKCDISTATLSEQDNNDNCVLSVINCLLWALKVSTSNVNDGATPASYTLKKDNLIISATNDSLASWNS